MYKFIILFFTLFPAAVQSENFSSLSSRQEKAVEETLQKHIEKQKLISLAVGVISRGKVSFLKVYGLANKAQNIPATTDTVYNWASNSKPLLATAAVQLIENKKLDIDKNIREYIPSFPDKGETITARQLLCHTSGIPHYENGKIISTRLKKRPNEFNPLEALYRFDKSPLIFKPGKKYSYSSFAYVLLSAVVQNAGNEDLTQQLMTRIIKPLKMDSFQLDVPTKGQKNWAMGYIKNKSKIVPAAEYANFWKHGAGGYKSSIKDFAKWAEALVNGKFLSRKARTLLWTQQKNTSFGLGFKVSKSSRSLKAYHGGSQSEAKTELVVYPDKKHGVVLMSNCNYADLDAVMDDLYKTLYKVKVTR